jgi:hypothetical protein
MKTKFKFILFAILAIIGIPVLAADLSYSPLTPQTGDSELVIQHKAQLAETITALAVKPGSYSNITATGTTTITGVNALDRIVVNKAGGTDTSIVIKDGATTFATMSGAAQATLEYRVAITTGTLQLVTTGTAPNVTVVYR